MDLSTNSDEVYTYAKEAILEQDGLVYLAPMAFQNTYALAVTEDYAQKNGIEKISDLAKVQQTAVAGFSLEFNDREDGNIGLKNLYNLQLNVKTMEPALRYEAIKNGDVQIVEAFSTDSKVVTYKLKILEDDKQLFPPYQSRSAIDQRNLREISRVGASPRGLGRQHLDRGNDPDELCSRCGRQVGRASGEGIFRTRRIVKIGENTMSNQLENAKNLYLRGIRDGEIKEVHENYMGVSYTQHSTGVPR